MKTAWFVKKDFSYRKTDNVWNALMDNNKAVCSAIQSKIMYACYVRKIIIWIAQAIAFNTRIQIIFSNSLQQKLLDSLLPYCIYYLFKNKNKNIFYNFN